eukprot:9863671-Karenia_brevis.AAC.1
MIIRVLSVVERVIQTVTITEPFIPDDHIQAINKCRGHIEDGMTLIGMSAASTMEATTIAMHGQIILASAAKSLGPSFLRHLTDVDEDVAAVALS